MKSSLLLSLVFTLFMASCQSNKAKAPQEEWIQLFNGKDLTGWTVKIKDYPVNENFGNTFRVVDSLLTVNYDGYDNQFNSRYGHIYTNQTYSHYKLRVEYRFIGEQLPDGPGWAIRNSGAMLHAQSPESVLLDQDFPVSIEAQMLGGNGTDLRTTGNVCTPGTYITLDGVETHTHCIESKSKTYAGDQWVCLEMIVHGDSIIHHVIGQDTIITYTNLRVDGINVNPVPNVMQGVLREGRIALQSESHPVQFRKVEIMILP